MCHLETESHQYSERSLLRGLKGPCVLFRVQSDFYLEDFFGGENLCLLIRDLYFFSETNIRPGVVTRDFERK